MMESKVEVNADNPYLPKPAAVTMVKNESLDTKTLRLRLIKWSAAFMPGQFVQLLLPGVGEAPFCITSSSSDSSHIELTVLRRGIVTTAAQYLRPGDAVGVRGPLGRPFPVSAMEGRDVLIVATGIGIAALRSLVFYIVEHRQKFGEVNLLYGARFTEDLIYRDEISRWSESINVFVTLSKAAPEWCGLRGRITEHMDSIKFNPRMVATVCGSPAVMASVTDELVNHGLDINNIYVSMERHMKCGIGKCARCMILGGLHVCRDGPVFTAAEVNMAR